MRLLRLLSLGGKPLGPLLDPEQHLALHDERAGLAYSGNSDVI
jgi:hypothetical protein